MKINEELKALLISSLELPDVTIEDINDTAILFGPQSILDLDSIDAVTFSAELRNNYEVPATIEISLEDFISIEKTVEWLNSFKTTQV